MMYFFWKRGQRHLMEARCVLEMSLDTLLYVVGITASSLMYLVSWLSILNTGRLPLTKWAHYLIILEGATKAGLLSHYYLKLTSC